jgi:hypothetical protein
MLTEKKNRKGTVYFEDNGVIVAKTCAKCNEVKSLDAFTKHKAGLGGRESSCKDCKAGYYIDNKADYVERYENNKAHLHEVMRKYYEANKESIAEYQRRYYAENKEVISERYRAYRRDNKEYLTELSRKWRQNNSEKAMLITERRRARKQSLPDDFTEDQMLETLNFFGGCALTGAIDSLHWDHAIPLATGFGGTTFGNMIPLRGDLNMSKSDANIFEWFDANKERFNLSQERFYLLIEWLADVNDMTTEEYRSYVYWCFDNKRDISNEIGNHLNDQTA